MIAQELEVSLHMAFMDARQKRHRVHHRGAPAPGAVGQPVGLRGPARLCSEHGGTAQASSPSSSTRHIPIVTGDEVDTQPTLGFQRVIQRAILHVQTSGKKEVTGANVLVAIFGERSIRTPSYFLHKSGVTRLDVVNYISHGVSKVQLEN